MVDAMHAVNMALFPFTSITQPISTFNDARRAPSFRLQNPAMGDSQSNRRGLRLLSLDGGGIRGLSGLLILKQILESYKSRNNLTELPKPYELFDLAGGTSTGGLIVIMLFRLKMSIGEAIRAYIELAEYVFSERNFFFQDHTFKATRLEEAIIRVIKGALKIESDEEARQVRLLDENSPKCFVCAVSAINLSSPTFFRSWTPSKLAVHLRTTIVEAARATCAAPTFFSSVDIVGDEGLIERFVDGGILVNNPTKSVLDQAKDVFPNSSLDYVLSLGNGRDSVIKVDSDDSIFMRMFNTRLLKALVKIATDCEYTANEVGHKLSDTPDVYYRLNVDRGLEGVTLSEWAKFNAVKVHTIKYLEKEDISEKVDRLVKKLYQTPSLPIL